jgi:hypothetical protein
MVKEAKKEGEAFYICEECDFAYKEKTWAEKCERFCSKHHACSLEITSHAVKMDTLNLRKQNFY